ncbi:MAG: hypothetical protein EOP40_14015 [Rubrivivax sp.]|nr:MAG: hypothetical protein EOP40_14015 [Rubrivivax sp.]
MRLTARGRSLRAWHAGRLAAILGAGGVPGIRSANRTHHFLTARLCMHRWLLAFILALVLPCYGFAAAGQALQTRADTAPAGALCQPASHPAAACDAAELQDKQPGQHDASDDVSSQSFLVIRAPGLPMPGSLALSEPAPPFLEGVMRPPSPAVRSL